MIMKKNFLVAIIAILFLGNTAIAQNIEHYVVNDKIVIKTNVKNIKEYEVFYSNSDNNYTKIPDNQLTSINDKSTIIWSGYSGINVNDLHIKLVAVATLTSTIKDSRDGKIYKTTIIGKQEWMAENLVYKASSGCWVYDNNSSNVSKYGYLYNWETANNVCPAGWHLPSYAEWTELTTYVGAEASKKLKAKNGWEDNGWVDNGNGTDDYGFTALPGGLSLYGSSFHNDGAYGYWWSSSLWTTYSALYFYLVFSDNPEGYFDHNDKAEAGCSVRCVRDN